MQSAYLRESLIMIKFDTLNQIHIYSGPTSMKMGIYKIQMLVALNFSPAEIINSVFIFCSKNKKNIKIYYENEYGYWLLQNRISQGNFKWPEIDGQRIRIDRRQLTWLLKGLDVIEMKPKKTLNCNYY